MIDEIERSNKHCDCLINKIKVSADKNDIKSLISELQKESLKFNNYYKDSKSWPQQSSRIKKQIGNIRKYISFANELEKTR